MCGKMSLPQSVCNLLFKKKVVEEEEGEVGVVTSGKCIVPFWGNTTVF